MKLLIAIGCLVFIFSHGFTSCVKDTPPKIVTDTLIIKDTVRIKDTITKTLVLQPGANDGRDVNVANIESDGGGYANANNIHNPDLSASRWTFGDQGGGQGTFRAYIKFSALYGLPDGTVIKSAKLSLFGVAVGTAAPQGNSSYPGSPYAAHGEDNKAWLKRVTENWNERTITWNNKPPTTDENQVEIPASTSQFNNDAPDLDVTKLVQDMLNDNKKTAGFCFQLQNESIYRTLNFASSRYSDTTKHPKLVVVYTIPQ